MAAIALIVIGSALGVPIAMVLGVVTLVLDAVHVAWGRRGLGPVRYTRKLGARRAPFGEPIPLEIEAWNRGSLRSRGCARTTRRARASRSASATSRTAPSPGRASCATPGRSARGSASAPVPRVRRAARRVQPGAGRAQRGRPVRPPRRRASSARHSTPSSSGRGSIPTTELEPPDRWGDRERTKASLAEDPARFAGVRPWAPGRPGPPDPRAGERAGGGAAVKRFEPSRDREVLIALDVQAADGPVWELGLGRRRRRVAVLDRRLDRAPAGRAAGRVRDPRRGLHRRRDADRERGGVVGARPGGARARPARAPVRPTPRCRSSGSSRSPRGPSGPGPRCSS